MTAAGGHDIELVAAGVPDCPRCSGPGLLAVRIPHSWTNRSGQEVCGWREQVLCPVCDAGDRGVGEILVLFTIDAQVSAANLSLFMRLAGEWAKQQCGRTPDFEALAEEEALWRRGEL